MVAFLALLALPVLPACGDTGSPDDGNPQTQTGTDADNDGYEDAVDCDDDDPNIHPDATEYCNGRDDDCDGQTDESDSADAATWYTDEDGDGFGDAATATNACVQPPDTVSDHSDCDDADAASNPNAKETCDGQDDDCDGLVDEDFDEDRDGWAPCTGDCDEGDPSIHPEATEVVNDGIDQDCDGGDACFPDEDADGYGALVSVASTDLDCTDAGEATRSGDCDDTDPAVNPEARELCGDGIDNDCDGAPGPDCSLTGEISLSNAAAKLVGEAHGDYAGIALASGDVNGDGFDDILVGANQEASGGEDAGAAYLVLGPAKGTMGLSTADAKILGEHAGDVAGSELAIGDVDGDGVEDILVGANEEDTGDYYAGAVYLVLGPTTGTVNLSTADAKFVGEDTPDKAGSSLASGDINGDGWDDVLIGAIRAHEDDDEKGAAYLIYGGGL